MNKFTDANVAETRAGRIVLSVGVSKHLPTGGERFTEEEAATLDELHLRKIDVADEVLVVTDEGGYFGASTAREIDYAIEHGKPIRFMVPGTFAETEVRERVRKAAKECPE